MGHNRGFNKKVLCDLNQFSVTSPSKKLRWNKQKSKVSLVYKVKTCLKQKDIVNAFNEFYTCRYLSA